MSLREASRTRRDGPGRSEINSPGKLRWHRRIPSTVVDSAVLSAVNGRMVKADDFVRAGDAVALSRAAEEDSSGHMSSGWTRW
jgi:hypothetical protein